MKKLFSSLFLTLALGLLLGAFCDVSKAESISNLEDYINYISNECNLSSSEKSLFINELSSYDYKYIVRFETLDSYTSGLPVVVYGFCPVAFNLSPVEIWSSPSRYTVHWGSGYQSVVSRNLGYTDARFVFVGCTNNSTSFCYSYTTTSKAGTNSSSGFDYWNTNYNSVFNNGIGAGINYCSQTNIYYWSEDETLPKFGFRYNGSADFNLSSGSSSWQLLSDLVNPYVEDDRLRIYTLETLNGKELNLNLSDFMGAYSAAASVNFTDITVILNCDNTDYTFQLSDQNSELYKVWEPYAEMFICKTLYSVFDVDQFSDVYLTAVSFNEVRSSAGGTFTEAHNISCNYVLKETSEPLEPEVVPDPDYNDTDVYSDQQIQDMKSDLHEKSSRFSFVSGDWIFVQEEDLPSFPGWATVYENYVWFADVNSDTTYKGHWWQMANNIPSAADLTRPFDPSEWYEQNKTFAFYDVILLKVWRCGVHLVGGTPVVSVDELAGYLVCISDRYYDHYNSELNLDLIKQLQLSAENSVLFYDALKTRLDDFAEDMDSGFNGFLDLNDGTQYQIINWLKTLDNDITGSLNNMQGVLTSGFSDVVSAINGIVIPSGGSSYSLPALSDELEYLFKPSLEWSAINYNDYVESLGVLALPFEFTFDVLDIAENQYDSDLKLHINQLSVDLPLEAGSDPQTTSFTVLSEQDIDFEPTSVVPAALWSTLQYLNAFGLVLVQALGTYTHIFRGGDK